MINKTNKIMQKVMINYHITEFLQRPIVMPVKVQRWDYTEFEEGLSPEQLLEKAEEYLLKLRGPGCSIFDVHYVIE